MYGYLKEINSSELLLAPTGLMLRYGSSIKPGEAALFEAVVQDYIIKETQEYMRTYIRTGNTLQEVYPIYIYDDAISLFFLSIIKRPPKEGLYTGVYVSSKGVLFNYIFKEENIKNTLNKF